MIVGSRNKSFPQISEALLLHPFFWDLSRRSRISWVDCFIGISGSGGERGGAVIVNDAVLGRIGTGVSLMPLLCGAMGLLLDNGGFVGMAMLGLLPCGLLPILLGWRGYRAHTRSYRPTPRLSRHFGVGLGFINVFIFVCILLPG